MDNSTPTIQLPFTTSHAFLIGIDDYEQVSSLSTAVNDTEALAQALTADHAYQVHPPLLNATKAQIMHLLEVDLPRLVQEEDRVFFYFAGHGIALDSDNNPKGYLIPADARPGDSDTLVAMDAFHQAITKLPCQHGLLILDCCFAGAFRWSTGFRDVVFDLPGIIYEERFYQYAKDPAWQVITSSASDQKAVDILSDRTLGMRNAQGEHHSPFAQALLDGIAGAADIIPQEGGDGVITATELYSYLRDWVEDLTIEQGKRQSPAMFSLGKHDKGQYIFLHPNHRLNLPPIPKRNPFMGLNSYDESDSALFYGRDRVIAALAQKVEQQRLVVVSGASGTGKSSVVKAGLLPRLRKEGWQILPIVRPGKNPLKNLKRHLPQLEEQLPGQAHSLLIIDQYEELITQCQHPDDRLAFETQLDQWLKKYPQLQIVISIRSDFEPQFENATLTSWWQQGRYLIPAFSHDELREVIIKPTVQEVLFFEPDSLVDKLIDAVNQAPGALPLLSFTLSELYYAYLSSGRTNRAFTLEDYEKLGGVIGALRTRANSIFDNFDNAHKKSMFKLVLRMVSIEGGELASRRVNSNDLVFSDPQDTQRIQKVAQEMVAARLLSTGRDVHGQAYYEPAHDALMRAWARLWEWIKKFGEIKLGMMHKLGAAVVDYERTKLKGYLWNDDPNLRTLLRALKEGKHIFNAKEEQFLKQSNRRRRIKKLVRRSVFVVGFLFFLITGGVFVSSLASGCESDLDLTNQMKAAEQTLASHNKLSQDILKSKREAVALVSKSVEALTTRNYSGGNRLTALVKELEDYHQHSQLLVPTEYLGNWGYADGLGHIAIYPHYEEVCPFEDNGEATVKYNGYYYQINKEGTIVGAADALEQWVYSNDQREIPANAVVGGYEIVGQDTIFTYIGRVNFRGKIYDGTYSGKIKQGTVYYGRGGEENHYDSYLVLTLGEKYEGLWVYQSEVTAYEKLGWKQVLASWYPGDNPSHYFLARVSHNGGLIPGRIQYGNCAFPSEGFELEKDQYQVYLVAKKETARPPAKSEQEVREMQQQFLNSEAFTVYRFY